MVRVNVAGGTGAGKKRPLRQRRESWLCVCPAEPNDNELFGHRVQPGWKPRCDDCGTCRPE